MSFRVPAIAICLMITGCSAESAEWSSSDEPRLGVLSQPIIGGMPIADPTYSGVPKLRLIADDFRVFDCSSGLVRNHAVVTAKHCFEEPDVSIPWNVTVTQGGESTMGMFIYKHSTRDVAVVLLATPLSMQINGTPQRTGYTLDIYDGEFWEDHREVIVAGYGPSLLGDPSSIGELHVGIVDANYPQGQSVNLSSTTESAHYHMPGSGDSGGPIGYNGKLLSVVSSNNHDWEPTSASGPGPHFWRDWANDAIRGALIPASGEPFSSSLDIYDVEYPAGSSANWVVQNGVLRESTNYYTGSRWPGEGSYLLDHTRWVGDAAIAVSVRSTAGGPNAGPDNDSAGIIFRWLDNNNYYRVSVDGEGRFVRFAKKHNGIWTNIREATGIDVNYSSFRTISVHAQGSTFTVYYNNQSMFTATDSTFQFGRVALYDWGLAYAEFDNLAIVPY